MFKNWDGDDVVGAIFGLVVVSIVFLGIFAICQDHQVRNYYLNDNDGRSCVYANWNWHSDERVYCSEDVGKTLDVLERSNKMLHSK